ncbi:hypothetical protein BV25DRAFT_1821472 [Artomyces pyxidatus]|uniref:Uncharacterized protein n=1 Tax=Artomyces pyxidatus TaxID=48021 RepID=A0ACB8TAF9_9AGAM|nr:hypothetical protein BV25DRAFT_1821472 [Artomyces pyxidatus]
MHSLPGHSYPAWLAVTHVCQRWRQIALSTPSLWTDIMTRNRFWANEMLVRSASVPIRIWINARRSFEGHEVLNHFSRAKILVFNGDVTPTLARHLSVPAPLLEDFALNGVGSRRFRPNSRLGASTDSIFPEGAPNLRHLRLSLCHVSWPLHLINSNIVTFHIMHLTSSHRPSQAQLQAALAAMPNLKDLVLDNCLPIQYPISAFPGISDDIGEGTLLMPSVDSINLAAPSSIDIYNFIAHVRFPSVRTVSLSSGLISGTFDPNRNSIPALLASLRSFYEPVSQIDHHPRVMFESLSLEEIEQDYWHLSVGGPMMNTFDPMSAVAQFETRLSVHIDSASDDDADSFFAAACYSLPLHTVETLVINCCLLTARDSWIQAFGRMKNVSCIFARGDPVPMIAEMLNPLPLLSQGDIGPALFPRLEELAIARADFFATSDEHPTSLYTHLSQALAWRGGTESGMRRLARLCVRECEIGEEYVHALDKLITHGAVDWDGVQNWVSENVVEEDDDDVLLEDLEPLGSPEHSDG